MYIKIICVSMKTLQCEATSLMSRGNRDPDLRIHSRIILLQIFLYISATKQALMICTSFSANRMGFRPKRSGHTERNHWTSSSWKQRWIATKQSMIKSSDFEEVAMGWHLASQSTCHLTSWWQVQTLAEIGVFSTLPDPLYTCSIYVWRV